MNYLAICAILRDEREENLREWIDYHRLIGVEHFFLYDNESRIPICTTLADEIDQGWVSVIPVSGRAMQLPAYAHCLHHFGESAAWIAFLDGDEAIVPKSKQDLRDYLRDFESYAALGANWLIFGSSNHAHPPATGQIESYLLRTPITFGDNHHIKSIVQPSRVIFPKTAHAFFFKTNEVCVDESGESIEGSLTQSVSVNTIQINHYFCRSRDEFEEKLARGRADSGTFRDPGEFDHYNLNATIEDRAALELFTKRRIDRKLDSAPVNRGSTDLESDLTVDSAPQVGVQRLLAVARKSVAAKEWNNAILALVLATERYPDAETAYIVLSDLYFQLKKYGPCWRALALAWKRFPDHPSVMKRLGPALYLCGKLDEAEKALTMNTLADPSDFRTWYFLGRVRADRHEIDLAKVALRRCLELKPDHAGARQLLARLTSLM